MKWEEPEEMIVGTFYLKNVNDWRKKIKLVMNQLHSAGYVNRDENSTRMRISNFEYLHTNKGLAHASKQTIRVYNELRNKFPNI